MRPSASSIACSLDLCSSLEKLGEIGRRRACSGAKESTSDASADHVRRVRARVDQFNERIGEIEGRRSALIDRIKQQQGYAELMEDVLFEALEEEERRKQEWIVEREISKLPAYKAFMPWTRGGEDDKRFRKSAGNGAAAVPDLRRRRSVLFTLPERICEAGS